MAGVKRLQSIVGTLGGLLFAAQCEAGDDPPAPVWPGRFHAELYQIRTGDQGITDLWYDYAAGRNLNIIQTQSGEEDGPLFDNERSNGTGYYYLPAKAKAKYCDIIDFGDVGLIKPDWLAGATYLGEETSGIYDCYKWEQGEIPEAHLKFLGLRPEKRSPPPASDRDAIHRFQHPELGDLPVSGDLPGDEDVETWSQHQTPMASSRRRGATASEGRFITYWSEKGTDRPVKWVFFDDAQFEVIRFDPGATMKDEMFQLPDYCFSDGLMGEDISGETLGQAS